MIKDKISPEIKQKYWGYKTILHLLWKKIKQRQEIKLRNSQYRNGFLEEKLPILDTMPVSNGSRYYKKLNIKIGIIADEFLYDSFKDSADFIYLTPDNYMIHIHEVEFLLLVSAWRGLHNEWRVMATEGTENNKIIHDLITKYKKAGKTVVFYSKEDPPNYKHFLPIAKRCDVIFTSCIEKVKDYKKDCNTENVHVMEFCINPVFHNPIGMCNKYRLNGVLFAGSWMLKYPKRIKAMEIMLDGVLKTGKELVIADRNFTQNNITYFFPRKYYPYITKEIPHDYLQKLHKLYNWAININSITESKTMFANRVYELQANGCLMISNKSIGVQEKFNEVIIVETEEDVKNALERFNAEEIYYHQINGIRRVMTGETNYDRIMKLLNVLDIECEKIEHKVAVVVEKLSKNTKEMFNVQTYPYKELIIKSDLTEEKYSQYDMVTLWNTNDKYEPHYLEDMINGFKYTNCDYITKNCFKTINGYVGNVEHDYVDEITNIYATVFWRDTILFEEFSQLYDNEKRENGYSIDHFNYEQIQNLEA